MTAARGRRVELTCHPGMRTDAVRGLEARVERTPHGVLTLVFSLDADLARLCIPAARAPRIVHDLWRHTCFEAFVAEEGKPAYHEFNFAPSGEWGAFAFHRYRDGAPLADTALAPRIAVRSLPGRLELDAVVPLGRLSPGHAQAPLRLALATVVEETSGVRSYWALHHPAGEPDFHHPDAFRLRLEPPGAAC